MNLFGQFQATAVTLDWNVILHGVIGAVVLAVLHFCVPFLPTQAAAKKVGRPMSPPDFAPRPVAAQQVQQDPAAAALDEAKRRYADSFNEKFVAAMQTIVPKP